MVRRGGTKKQRWLNLWRFFSSASVSQFGNAECLEHPRMHTLMPHGHHFSLQEMIWAVLFTRLPPVKGWMCALNFFLFSIGSIYFLSTLFLYLLRQSAFYIPSPFSSILPPPLWEHYYSAADADPLNSISLCCCNMRGGYHDVKGREKGRSTRMRAAGRAQEVHRFKTFFPFFFPWRTLS